MYSAKNMPGFDVIRVQQRELDPLIVTINNAYENLSATLAEDMQPEDLVIGGTAVERLLNPNKETPPLSEGARLTQEHWWKYDDTIARVSKVTADDGIRENASLLARYVKDPYAWLPGAAKRRSDRFTQITWLFDPDRPLSVDLFARHEPPTDQDQALADMRTAAESASPDRHRLQQRVHICPGNIGKPLLLDVEDRRAFFGEAVRTPQQLDRILNKNTLSPEDKATLEALKLQANTQADDKDSSPEQRLINEALTDIRVAAGALLIATQVVNHGQRMRPTRPQHALRLK